MMPLPFFACIHFCASPVPTATPSPTYPLYGRLPQTGQLNWPVPVLALAGLALVAVGVWLTRRKAHGE